MMCPCHGIEKAGPKRRKGPAGPDPTDEMFKGLVKALGRIDRFLRYVDDFELAEVS